MKIKFRALCLAALVVVMAFASVASAATFVGVDSAGSVEKITVDPSKTAGSRVTYESIAGAGSRTSSFAIASGVTGYKFFAYEGGIVAVKATTTTANGAEDVVVFFKVAEDGTVTFEKELKNTNSNISNLATGTKTGTKSAFSGIKDVIDFNGDPVFLSDKVLTTVNTDNWVFDATKFISFDISIDTAFVVNSKLYLLSSNDTGAMQGTTKYQQTIRQIAKITTDVDDLDKTKGQLNGTAMNWVADGTYPGAFHAVVTENAVYVATETGLYKFPMKEITDTGIILTSNAPTVTSVNTNSYVAMTAYGDTLYGVLSKDSTLSLVSITNDEETVLYKKVSDDVLCVNNNSFDIYYSATDKVIAVVSQGTTTAFYAPASDSDASTYKLIDERAKIFPTLALVKTASSSGGDDSKGETTTTTVVNASTLATASQDNLVAATPASAISDFVTAEEASTSTVPSGAQAKIEALLKTDDKTTVTLAAKTNYTPAKDGYLLVKEAVDVSKVRVYFVEAATTTAATGDLTAATFLDADCKEMGSTGTSVYAASDKLESGKTYTLVEATVSTSSSGDDGDDSSGSTTSSSSSGCDAGFGLWAAAALMAVSTISKRR